MAAPNIVDRPIHDAFPPTAPPVLSAGELALPLLVAVGDLAGGNVAVAVPVKFCTWK